MSKYRGPRLRLIRRIDSLPGLTNKTSRRTFQSSRLLASSSLKLSKFSIRLREKQKLRFNYGITEQQLLNYVKRARKEKGSSGRILLTLLEMRLDNIIFRLGWAPTIFAAKQLVNHGHILVNNCLVDVPSFMCLPGNVICVRNYLKSKNLVEKNLKTFFDNLVVPQHLSFSRDNLVAKVHGFVNRKSISLIVNELLVIEYYSRKF
uniref:Small ribosomal subunit protein uS4c n=1 Tax=Trachelomonas grandis TaxID=215769 RepID=A0A385UK30_9EUGL|nr:ribosomal protein S4 [Trachelomonas grandis]